MSFFTNDNLTLFYREQGQGELLLILPGNTASSSCHLEESALMNNGDHPLMWSCPDVFRSLCDQFLKEFITMM